MSNLLFKPAKMSAQKENDSRDRKHNAILSKAGLPDAAELFLANHKTPLTANADASAETAAVADGDLTLPAPSAQKYSVYGEEWCGFTQRAQALLRERQLPYQYSNLGDERAKFAQRYADGHRTMPIVFHKGQFIGGFEQLKNYL